MHVANQILSNAIGESKARIQIKDFIASFFFLFMLQLNK
jgi:hypothetical protein